MQCIPCMHGEYASDILGISVCFPNFSLIFFSRAKFYIKFRLKISELKTKIIFYFQWYFPRLFLFSGYSNKQIQRSYGRLTHSVALLFSNQALKTMLMHCTITI